MEDNGFFADDPDAFCALLDGLVVLRGCETVERWQALALARAVAWADMFGQMMSEQYDPLYNRSIDGHYAGLAQAQDVDLADGGADCLRQAARQLLAAP